jgi:hypothetical protein
MTMLAGWTLQGPTPLPPGFDLNLLVNELIPLVGIVMTFVVGGFVLRWLFRSPMAEAMAERIRARTRSRYGASGSSGEIEGERVAQLEQHLSTIQDQLSELAERVDFAERVLAERRERKLSAGE